MKKRIIFYPILIVVFLGILFLSFFAISKMNRTNVYKAFMKMSEVNTAKIKVKVSNTINGDTMRFLYNFNYNKNYSDDKYSKVISTEGTFGIELDEEELGFYAPLVFIIDNDIEGFLTIDESYEDILGIPGGDTVHFTLTSLRKNIGVNGDFSEITNVVDTMKKPITNYLKKHKSDFKYFRSEKQTLTSGVIGRLAITLTEENINDFYSIFKENLKDTYLERYKINSFYNTLLKKYNGGVLYIDIYGNYINKISLIGQNDSIEIEISNVNNPNTITIPNESFIELVNYITNGIEDILGLFGFEIEISQTRISYLQNKFADFASFMIGCIDYSDSSNFEYAEVCIENMTKIIQEMKTKIFEEDEESVNDTTYNKYIEFFEEILNYCTIYKEDCEDENVDMSRFLDESIKKLNELSSALNIDLGFVE